MDPTKTLPAGTYRLVRDIDPPRDAACTNVSHNEINCLVAELPPDERCGWCREEDARIANDERELHASMQRDQGGRL